MSRKPKSELDKGLVLFRNWVKKRGHQHLRECDMHGGLTILRDDTFRHNEIVQVFAIHRLAWLLVEPGKRGTVQDSLTRIFDPREANKLVACVRQMIDNGARDEAWREYWVSCEGVVRRCTWLWRQLREFASTP